LERLQLIGGSYVARSIIANAQRCVNLYPERNPKDSPTPVTHYQRPGFRKLVSGPQAAVVRGLYRASNGNGYCVIGNRVFFISPGFFLTQIGALVSPNNNPVSFIDNGIDILLVDSSPVGYQIQMSNNAFSQIVDSTGTFVGATRVDYIDTFVLWNLPNTVNFGSTHSNSLIFDPLYTAGKVGYPDPLVTLMVNHDQILLIGQLKGEIWYDAGGALFPFAKLPGAYIEHGCAAPYSIAYQDIAVYWLSSDLQGQGVVVRQRGYSNERISNHALEYAIQQMAANGSITDAIGYTYQQGGHVFYVLIFPSGNETWVFDESTQDWHQRAWTDQAGNLNRDRSNCHAFIYGTNVVGDWQNGTLYALDPNYYTDQVSGDNGPISYIRGFPHIVAGRTSQGQMVLANGLELVFRSFMLDLECGNGPADLNGNPPQVGLRWSDTRGKTWGNTILQSAGATGHYLTRPTWKGLGLARDRVFEVNYSFAGPAALQGAWVDAELATK